MREVVNFINNVYLPKKTAPCKKELASATNKFKDNDMITAMRQRARFNEFISLLVYQDDSSDEMSDVLDELLPPASDTEEQWNLDEADEGSSAEEGGEMEAEGDENESDVESESEDKMVNGAGITDDESESADGGDDM